MSAKIFCTLFDSNYFSRGLAMYESLRRHCPEALLYVFAFDDECLAALGKLALPGMVRVSLAEFEDPGLLAAKANRSRVEYLWTSSSSTILWVLERFGYSECTYVDADLYFYDSPAPIFEELGADSVLITEHRFTPHHDQTRTSGIYNVQFMTFRNDARGLEVLRWWRAACLESCELNPDEGKCGDQKYLDDWTKRFEGVHVLQHLGGGVAPWNVQQYSFAKEVAGVAGTEIRSGRRFPLIFYHFHGLKLTRSGRVLLTGATYEISDKAFDLIYRPYVRSLDRIGKHLAKLGLRFDPHGRIDDDPVTLRIRLGRLKRRMTRPEIVRGPADNVNVPYDLADLV
jgi:hypothetical protein